MKSPFKDKLVFTSHSGNSITATKKLEDIVAELNAQRKSLNSSKLQNQAAKAYISNYALGQIAEDSKGRRAAIAEVRKLVHEKHETDKKNVALAKEVEELEAKRDAIYEIEVGPLPAPTPPKRSFKKPSKKVEVADFHILVTKYKPADVIAKKEAFLNDVINVNDDALRSLLAEASLENIKLEEAIFQAVEDGNRISALLAKYDDARTSQKKNAELKNQRDDLKGQIADLQA